MRDASHLKRGPHNGYRFLRLAKLWYRYNQKEKGKFLSRPCTQPRNACNLEAFVEFIMRSATSLFSQLEATFSRRKLFKTPGSGHGKKILQAHDDHKTTSEILGLNECRKNEIQNCREIHKEIQELSFPGVGTEYHHSLKKMLAFFADMWSGELGCIEPGEYRIEVPSHSCPFRSNLNQAGTNVQEIREI